MLLEQGYNVKGVTMLLHDTKSAKDAIEDAKKLACIAGIEHEVVDFRKEFEEIVINDFVEKYSKGKTPNPCVICNRHIKFGLLEKYTKNLGYDYFATGHYARIERKQDEIYLKKAVDLSKDQSYFLHDLSKDQLEMVIFPLGDISSKSETRKYLSNRNFEIASKGESQEICFIEDESYVNFLKKRIQIKDGDIIGKNGIVLGKHNGTVNYTVGQRKGLGISYSKPLFVTEVDSSKNAVYVGLEQDLYKDSVMIKNINIISKELLENKNDLTCKIRYRSKDLPIKNIDIFENDKICINFKNGQKSISPGQYAVIYCGEYVVGGGEITLE